MACGNKLLKTNQFSTNVSPSEWLHKCVLGVVKFTFNIGISKVLAALWPRLLTRQSLFVPPDVFRALSQQFLLRCIRTYIQCGTWSAAKPALLKVPCKKCPSGLIYFHFSQRHFYQVTINRKWLYSIPKLVCHFSK